MTAPLFAKGYIQKKISEKDYIEEMSLIPPFPQNRFSLEMTNICNHTCLFCPHHKKMTRKHGIINEEFLKRILKEAYELGAREVGMCLNGEAFLFKKLPEYIKFAKDIGYSYVFTTTNGALATDELIAEVINAGLDSIRFSIGAGCKETYKFIHGKDDFEKVKENLLYLSKLRRGTGGIYISISFIVTKYNVNEIDAFKEQFGELVDDIVFLRVKNVGGYMPETMDMINTDVLNFRLAHENCVWPFNGVVVTWEGYLTACCLDWQNYLAVADLNKTSLYDAWYGEEMQKLRQRFIDNDFSGTICQLCKNKEFVKPEPLVSELCTEYDFE